MTTFGLIIIIAGVFGAAYLSGILTHYFLNKDPQENIILLKDKYIDLVDALSQQGINANTKYITSYNLYNKVIRLEQENKLLLKHLNLEVYNPDCNPALKPISEVKVSSGI